MAIRLMIADDNVVVRKGIARFIEGTEIELVGEAETSEQTVKGVLACEPDVLLLEVYLSNSDGLAALAAIGTKNPRIAVLVFSANDEVKEMAHARHFGAQGFLTKRASREEVLRCIRRVAAGKSAWTPRQIRQVVSRAAAHAVATNNRDPLSEREMTVLRKITMGLPNEAIAEELGINIETVKQHVKHVLAKLHVGDRTQAALTAIWKDMLRDEPFSASSAAAAGN